MIGQSVPELACWTCVHVF